MPKKTPNTELNSTEETTSGTSQRRGKSEGKSKEKQPEMLPEKLLEIRQFFNFTQEEMAEYILPETVNRTVARAALSDYEKGRRTPSVLKLLNYAKAVRFLTQYKDFNLEDLVRDDKNLPWKNK
jgi:DNA-binding transcriptional regulator YiaG